jgi:4-oxalocrotonate tautomerase
VAYRSASNGADEVDEQIPEWTHITIEEIDTDNWGFGGRTTTAIRKERAG